MNRSVILFLLLSLLLSGCGKNDAVENAAGKAEIYIEPDTTLDLCLYNPDTLNPLETSVKHNAEVLSCLYDSLFTVSSDFTAVPELCETYQISDDGLRFTCTLRKGIVFRDGSPLSAEDAAYSLNTALAADGYYKNRLSCIRYAEATEDILYIYLSRTSENLCVLLDFPIIPHNTSIGKTDILAEPPLGSGLYIPEEYRTNDKLSLTVNRNHHSGRMPYFDTVVIHFADNASTAVSMLENGIIDILPGNVTGDVYTPPSYISTHIYPGCRYVFLGMQDTTYRFLISTAIHREFLLQPGAISATEPIHPLASYRSPAPANSSIHSVMKPSKPCKLLYSENAPGRTTTAHLIAEHLTNADVPTVAEGLSEQMFLSRIHTEHFDFFLGETELLPDFSYSASLERTIGLYFKGEALYFDDGFRTISVSTLNPYKSIHQWEPDE